MRDCESQVACIYRASLQQPYAILRSLAGALGPISRGDARQRRTQFALRKRARDTRDNLETAARDANNRGARANVGQRANREREKERVREGIRGDVAIPRHVQRGIFYLFIKQTYRCICAPTRVIPRPSAIIRERSRARQARDRIRKARRDARGHLWIRNKIRNARARARERKTEAKRSFLRATRRKRELAQSCIVILDKIGNPILWINIRIYNGRYASTGAFDSKVPSYRRPLCFRTASERGVYERERERERGRGIEARRKEDAERVARFPAGIR